MTLNAMVKIKKILIYIETLFLRVNDKSLSIQKSHFISSFVGVVTNKLKCPSSREIVLVVERLCLILTYDLIVFRAQADACARDSSILLMCFMCKIFLLNLHWCNRISIKAGFSTCDFTAYF